MGSSIFEVIVQNIDLFDKVTCEGNFLQNTLSKILNYRFYFTNFVRTSLDALVSLKLRFFLASSKLPSFKYAKPK